MTIRLPRHFTVRSLQRGVTTLVVSLSLLVILTIIILTSSNVALFEQKTTVNENRQMLAGQAAEYALNLAGEYLKANVVNIASNEDDDGWLTPAGSNLHWQLCPQTPTDLEHPCYAEADQNRRQHLYYYTADGTVITDASSALLDVPLEDVLPDDAELPSVGGTAAFPVTTRVNALLCRLDTTVGSTPSCQAEPSTGNRVAITLVSTSTLDGESAAAQIKETWGTYNNFNAQAAVPLVAAGVVQGLGNATIVAAPNAGGYGLPASIWSPNNVDVDASGTGVGSVSTCHLGDYLGDVPVGDLQTTCAANGSPCGCDVSSDSSDFLSGHIGSVKKEGLDILDVDFDSTLIPPASHGPLPDIEFFPGWNAGQTACMDDPADPIDDNLFEWIFSVDVNADDACTTDTDPALVDAALADLGATVIASCDSLDATSSGLFQATDADCDLPGQMGSPDNPVVLVVDDYVRVNNSTIYGMLFVRDSTGAGTEAGMDGNGHAMVFGSVVVEGEVNITGGIDIVYVDTSAGSPGKKLPATTRFARLPGSWLDSRSGF
jgi:hypothetical protein